MAISSIAYGRGGEPKESVDQDTGRGLLMVVPKNTPKMWHICSVTEK